MDEGVGLCAASLCEGCGLTVEHRPPGGPLRRHACRWRWLARARWRSHQAGWHSGYRFAVEHRDDPLVLADGFDYGSGWAGHMRAGGMALPHRADPEEETRDG